MKKLLMLIAVVAFASMSFASTTGGLIGKVTTEDGTGLPGVTVVAKSPSLQGQKSTTTDASGKYRMILLPPGEYTMTFSMSGFQTITQKGVTVALGTNYTVNMVMKTDKLEESIIVTAEQPLIDSTSTTAGNNWTTDYIENIPTGRNIGSVLAITPGVTRAEGPSGGMVVAGASGTESSYVIDGMNTTNIETGVMGKAMNFDFVEEVQVKTGGYEAEYGRATGGVVNMITKSGGNEFHGSVFYYFRNRAFSAQQATPWFGTSYLGTEESDYGFSLGGPIIKDKLWFFVAYNPSNFKFFNQNNETAQMLRGSGTRMSETDRDYWSFKLTYNINENHTLVFSTFGDPTDAYVSQNGDITGDEMRETGGTDWILKYDGILTDSFVINFQIGTHEEKAHTTAADGSDMPQMWDYYLDGTHARRGGIGWHENTDRTRDILKLSGEWFWNNHDIKFGIDHETNTFNSKTRYSGDVVYRYGDLGDAVYIRRRMYAIDDPNGNLWDYWGGGDYYSQVTGDFLQRDTETVNQSMFIQDKWNVTDTLMLSLGYRMESQEINGNHPYEGGSFTALDIDNNDALRLGFTWDIFGNGTSKLYGHYGEFYSSIPLDINNRAFAQEVLFFDYWIFDKVDSDVNGDGVVDFYDFNPNNYQYTDFENSYFTLPSGAGGPAPVADNLNAMSQDEFILGFDYLLGDVWSVGLKFNYRTLNDILEDISFDAGYHYIIANPGQQLTFTTTFDLAFTDATGVERDYHAGDLVDLTPEQVGFAAPVRNYRAYEFSLHRKFADNWTTNFSIIYSKLWGNFIGGELPFYGQTDPGITAAYDLPSTLVNTEGKVLPFDRPWQIKWDGLYQFDWGLSVGWQYTYMSGTPIGAYGEPDDGSTGYYGEFRLIGNGAAGRTPQVHYLDLNFSYTYELGDYGSLTGYFYIYNIMNWQNALEVNQQFTQDTPSQEYLDAYHNGSYDNYINWIDGAFDTYDQLVAHAAEAGMEIYDNYMAPEVYQTPRYIRFGLKYKF